jgi:hypothetical protein
VWPGAEIIKEGFGRVEGPERSEIHFRSHIGEREGKHLLELCGEAVGCVHLAFLHPLAQRSLLWCCEVLVIVWLHTTASTLLEYSRWRGKASEENRESGHGLGMYRHATITYKHSAIL